LILMPSTTPSSTACGQIGDALHLDTAALWRWRLDDTTGRRFSRADRSH
jgi:hypothetical protein